MDTQRTGSRGKDFTAPWPGAISAPSGQYRLMSVHEQWQLMTHSREGSMLVPWPRARQRASAVCGDRAGGRSCWLLGGVADPTPGAPGVADAQEEAVDLGLWRFDSPRAATSFLRPLFVLYRESLKQIYSGCMWNDCGARG